MILSKEYHCNSILNSKMPCYNEKIQLFQTWQPENKNSHIKPHLASRHGIGACFMEVLKEPNYHLIGAQLNIKERWVYFWWWDIYILFYGCLF